MYRFWSPIIGPLFAELKPRKIIEIGVDAGDHTRRVLDYCRHNGATLHAIDPAPKLDIERWVAEHNPHLVFHKSLSLNALDGLLPADVILVDGDHNWYTVFNELQLVSKVCGDAASPLPLILLHDIAWPYGRRDAYCNPETVPEAFRQPHARAGLQLDTKELAPSGGFNSHMHNAIYENQSRNGVLTAIEDFLSQTDRQELRFLPLPGFHGLGILYQADLETRSPLLRDLASDLEATLGRTALLSGLERSRVTSEFVGQQLRAILKTRDATVAETQDALETTRRVLDEARGENASLRTQVADNKTQRAEWQEREEDLTRQNGELMRSLERDRAELEATRTERDEARATSIDDQRRIRELRDELRQLADQYSETHAELRETQGGVGQLRRDLTREKQRAKRLEQTIVKLASWLIGLGDNDEAVRNSRRLKIGNAVGNLVRLATLRKLSSTESPRTGRLLMSIRRRKAVRTAATRLDEEDRPPASASAHAKTLLKALSDNGPLQQGISGIRGGFATLMTSRRYKLADALATLYRRAQDLTEDVGHGPALRDRFRQLEVWRRRFVEGLLSASAPPADQLSSEGGQHLESSEFVLAALAELAPPTIVIPIFNAADALAECLDAVVRNTDTAARLLLIDDASTDPTVAEVVSAHALRDNLRVVRNDTNLGFTRTANRGISESNGDVVLLNSDTIVPPGWLRRLRLAAHRDPRIATVTAVSDNAGAFAVPEIGRANEMPPGVPRDTLGRSAAVLCGPTYPETPTGNGFCMYIKRCALDDVGLFDAEKYPRGYGEENDFSMRAMRRGWRHVVDDSTLVLHRRGESFGQEKARLATAGRAAVDESFPEYTGLVRRFVDSPAMRDVRRQYAEVLGDRRRLLEGGRRRVLFVLHQGSGGTPQTSRDLAAALEPDTVSFFLTSDTRRLRLFRLAGGDMVPLDQWDLDNTWTATDFSRADLRRVLFDVLTRYKIDLLHVRHLITHTFDAPDVAKALGIPVILSLHDFYLSCPTVHLLDENHTHCGGICTAGEGPCRIPTAWVAGLPPLKHAWVSEWRRRVGEMFENVDVLVTASHAAKDIYMRSYPVLSDRDFRVIEHGRDLEQAHDVALAPHPGGVIRIAVPGNLDVHKGAELLADLQQCDRDRRLEVHLLGRIPRSLRSLGICHGEYERDELVGHLRRIRPAFVGIFSISPETHCHVLTEAWAAGVPALVTSIGAPQERLRAHGGGFLIDVDSPERAYEQITAAADDPATYQKELERASLAGTRTIGEMAADYDFLYKEVAQRARTFATKRGRPEPRADVLRLALFVPAGPRLFNASTHVRLLTRLRRLAIEGRVSIQIADAQRFCVAPDTSHFDLAVVQRTAIPSGHAQLFVDRCRQMNRPFLFEIDDDLFNLQRGSQTQAEYAKHRDDLEFLARSANAVTVSTPALETVLRRYRDDIVIVPNLLDDGLWPSLHTNGIARCDNGTTRAAAVYIGTPTHREDLRMLRPAVETLSAELDGGFALYVIGGESEKTTSDWYERLPIPGDAKEYPAFATWLGQLAGWFDFAVAPLVEGSLNASKSHLKYLEYSALGLAGIYSAGPAYDRAVRNGETGLVVANTTREWGAAIERLATDAVLRERLAAAARRDVQASYLVEQSLDGYFELLHCVACEGRAPHEERAVASQFVDPKVVAV